MSTRANVIIKDSYVKLYFYRHSDGYPEGTLPTLKKFMLWVKEKKIRQNATQSSGWLIIIGAEEYNQEKNKTLESFNPANNFSGWKVGAYEPTDNIHGDIEYLYVLDLEKIKIKVKEVCGFDKDQKFRTIETIKDFKEV